MDVDKAVSVMFIKSVNSTRLDDIANSLTFGMKTKINNVKLNRNNRNCCVSIKNSSDIRLKCRPAVQIKKTSAFWFNTSSRMDIM